MSSALAVTVVLTGEDGLPVVLLPGTVPTKKQAKQITNPNVWADAEAEEIEEPAAEVEPEPANEADSDEDQADSEPQAPQVEPSADDEAPASSDEQ